MAVQSKVVLNDIFDPPQLVVQVPHYLLGENAALARISRHLINSTEVCPLCQELMNVSWDVWRGANFTNADYNQTYCTLVTGFMHVMLRAVVDGSNPFPENHTDWSWPLIESAMYFFSWKYTLNRYQLPPNLNGSDEISQLDVDYANRTLNGTHVFDLLHRHLLEALCQTMILGVWDGSNKQTKTCENILIDHSLPIIMDNSSIWMPVPANATQHHTLSCVLWQMPADYHTSVWTPAAGLAYAHEVNLYSEPLAQYEWEVDNRSFWWPTISSARLDGVWTRTRIMFSVAMKVTENRTGKAKDCNTDLNPKICLQKCSKVRAIKHCDCVPFSFHKGLKDVPVDQLPYCTEWNYLACNLTAFNDILQQEECVTHCSNPCAYTSYTFQVFPEPIRYTSDALAFNMYIEPILDPFIEFSQATKDKRHDILANIGGIVGLYLGLSGFSICVFIVSCVDFVKRYNKKKAGEKAAELKAISLWQMVLLKKANQKGDEGENVNRTPKDKTLHQSGQNNTNRKQEGKNVQLELKALIKDELKTVRDDLEALWDRLNTGMEELRNETKQLKALIRDQLNRLRDDLQGQIEALRNETKLVEAEEMKMKGMASFVEVTHL